MSKITSLAATMLIAGALTSCVFDKDEFVSLDGKARVAFDINAETSFSTRALDENNWKNASNYTVEILNQNNEVVGNYKANEITSIELEHGTYTVHAYYGTELSASQENFLCEGKTEFTLNINDEKNIKVSCSPTCGKVMVRFGAEMAKYFKDYYVAFSAPKMENGLVATWTKENSAPWYLAVGEKGDEVTATIHLTPNEQYMINKSKEGDDWSEGTVVRSYTLQRNKAWTLNIDPNYTPTKGQLGISLSINEDTNDQDVDVVIPAEWIN